MPVMSIKNWWRDLEDVHLEEDSLCGKERRMPNRDGEDPG